jgi:hypothetical protein
MPDRRNVKPISKARQGQTRQISARILHVHDRPVRALTIFKVYDF